MKNVLVVLNFNAGRRRAVKLKRKIQKFLFGHCKRFLFIKVEDLNCIDFELFDTVIAVGGDGTISCIAPYIINTDIVLGIIPIGTANLLAARLGISDNINKALNIIEAEHIKQIDVLNVGSALSILRCGFGYDFDIITKTPQSLKNRFGYFAYFIAGIIFSFRLKRKTYKFFYSNKTIGIEATCLIFANTGNMYRNLFSIAKNSKLDDGKFEIFILKTTNPVLLFWEILMIFLGIKINNRHVRYLQMDSITLRNDWSACHIDGDKVRLKGDININVIPKSLKICAG